MNKVIVSFCVMIFILMGSIVSNFIFYGYWDKEKAARVNADKELHKTKSLLEAAQKNAPELLSKVAKKFALTLFTGNKKNLDKRKKRLMSICTKEVGEQLFKNNLKVMEVTPENKLLSSTAKIKKSIYNRMSENQGKVIMKMEQTLKTKKTEEKTLQELTVYLKYVDKKWKVVKFEVEGLI